MKSLETKIPPPLVLALFALLIWLVRGIGPKTGFENSLAITIGVIFVIIALGIDLSALLEFRKFKTTVNPMAPNKARNIVKTGIYSKTRNPMYLGMVFLLIGWAIYNGAMIGLGIIPLFWLYITRFQIIPEERALIAKFGQEYLDYLKSVKPWL